MIFYKGSLSHHICSKLNGPQCIRNSLNTLHLPLQGPLSLALAHLLDRQPGPLSSQLLQCFNLFPTSRLLTVFLLLDASSMLSNTVCLKSSAELNATFQEALMPVSDLLVLWWNDD